MAAYFFLFPSRLRHDNDLLHTPFSWLLISELDMRAIFLCALMVVVCMMVFSCIRAFAGVAWTVIALHCIWVRLGASVVIYLAVFTAIVFTRE